MACLLASAVPAFAQNVLKDPSEAAQYRIGGFRFTPFLAVTDLGVDTNVYNEADSENPKQDTTATLGPGLEYWVRLGRAQVAAKSDVTYTWFRQYADQRSWNTDNSGTITLPLNRLSLVRRRPLPARPRAARVRDRHAVASHRLLDTAAGSTCASRPSRRCASRRMSGASLSRTTSSSTART